MKKKLVFFGGLAMFAGLLFFSGCASIPKNAKAVSNFNSEKYLGLWYEIARKDFKFERNMDNVTANYSMRDDGKIKVLNRGYHFVDNEWRESEGKAKFRGEKNIAELEVSFFGPFYSGYNVIAIDNDYKYALVVGKNLDYLWILSRTKTIPDNVKEAYLNKAKEIGYDISDLVWVTHNRD